MLSSISPPRRVFVPTVAPKESEAQLRRYRDARLRVEVQRRETNGRYGYLKRGHD